MDLMQILLAKEDVASPYGTFLPALRLFWMQIMMEISIPRELVSSYGMRIRLADNAGVWQKGTHQIHTEPSHNTWKESISNLHLGINSSHTRTEMY